MISRDRGRLHKEIFIKYRIEIENCSEIGLYQMDLLDLKKAQRPTFEVLITNTPYKNRGDFRVYTAKQEVKNGTVLNTDKLDKNAESKLKNGGSVLLLVYGKVGKEKGAQVAIGFSTVFWNTAWANVIQYFMFSEIFQLCFTQTGNNGILFLIPR